MGVACTMLGGPTTKSLSYPQLLLPERQGQHSTSLPYLIPNFQVCLRLSDATGWGQGLTVAQDQLLLQRPSKAPDVRNGSRSH